MCFLVYSMVGISQLWKDVADMVAFVRSRLEKLLLAERSCERLAASFCVGTFIALTPTIPLQTPLLFAVSWLCGLNAGVTFAAVYLINNPLTMIPIYVIDYAVGVWFFNALGIAASQYNPSWVSTVNAYLSRYIDINKYLGSDFCLWCLLVGGLLFALMVSVPLYPLLKRACMSISRELEKKKNREKGGGSAA